MDTSLAIIRRLRDEDNARADGYRNGRADALLSFYSEYARGGLWDAPNTYAYHYALGYRDGHSSAP